MLSEENKQIIKNHLISNEESCGLIICKQGKIIAYPCKNIAQEPNIFFTISPRDYLFCSKIGEIIGCYHTHEEHNYFREVDKMMANNLKLKYYLYCKKTDEFFEYIPDSYINTYTGRTFQYNKNDCFTLIREYYEKELNIKLEVPSYNDTWYKTQENLIVSNIEKQNFVQVESLQKNDIICLKYKRGENPSHLAIYLDNSILHQPRARLSLIEEYNQEHKNRTTHILRHKNLC